MSIVGFLQTSSQFGSINTSYTQSVQQNFASPVNVWSYPSFTSVDGGVANVWISQFVNSQGTHNGTFRPGIYSPSCTRVTFTMYTDNSVPTLALTHEFFA